MRGDPDAMVVVAILVSRIEALLLASMLENGGVFVRIDGVHHASVEPISVALTGHRLFVPAAQAHAAAEILRESRFIDGPVVFRGGRQAIVRFVAILLGSHYFFAIPAAIAGFLPLSALLGIGLYAFAVPVDPRGRGDFYLGRELEESG